MVVLSCHRWRSNSAVCRMWEGLSIHKSRTAVEFLTGECVDNGDTITAVNSLG